MKKIFSFVLICCLFINVCSANAALVQPAGESTKALNETFEKYTDNAQWYGVGDVSLCVEDNANKCLYLNASEDAAFTAKTFRKIEDNFVLELKYKTPEYCDTEILFYSKDYYKTPFCSLGSDGKIRIGEEVVTEYKKGEYNKITAIVFAGTKYVHFFVNDEYYEKLLPSEIKCVTGIAFSAEKGAQIYIDDVRCYKGNEIVDEYYLLNEKEKVTFILNDKVAVFKDCEYAVSGKIRRQINENDKSVKTHQVGNTMFVPLRYIAENLGATVEWKNPEIYMTKENVSVEFCIGKKEVIVNGAVKKIDEAPFISGQTTLVPLRAFSEALGYKVFWHDSGLVVIGENMLEFIEPEKEQEFIADINSMITEDLFYNDNQGVMMRITTDLGKTGRKIYPAMKAWADTSDTNIPSNLIDGSVAHWAGQGINISAYIDYGKEIDVEQLAISWTNGTSRNEYFEIYSSLDGENWTLEVPKRNSSGLSTDYELFDCKFKARYIRYRGFGNSAGEWNSVKEIVALGGKINEKN